MTTMFNPFVEQRKRHKLDLYDLIKKNRGVSKEQLIALFSLRTGLKRETIKGYIEELKEAGLIMEDERVFDEIQLEGNKQENKPVG